MGSRCFSRVINACILFSITPPSLLIPIMQYSILRGEDNMESRATNESHMEGLNNWSHRWKFAFLVSSLVNILMTLSFIYILDLGTRCSNSFPEGGQMIYTPSEAAINYKLVKYHLGIGHDTQVYEQPPSPEVDAAWMELTKYSITKVSQSIAQSLPNKTWPVPGSADAPEYITGPDVFHALHCLDLLRMKLYPDHYSSKFPLNQRGHAEHCIGHIRQSLMCFGDMTMNVYQYSKNHGYAVLRTDVAHTCRDFDKLKAWTEENWLDLEDEMLALDIHGDPIQPHK
ncbi:hypothetical protein J3R30DRAFT_3682556 [Lentinula aciculospora]|uniref:Uncharacterized protein n=1 Tax=Lentinula aciculospora TaxID=153920 RepID=A0A9W9AC03_9AGAR|nr:hypothetical protein J3R30DRAFT_3682556 [Lentinula aciculospora]